MKTKIFLDNSLSIYTKKADEMFVEYKFQELKKKVDTLKAENQNPNNLRLTKRGIK